MDWVSSNRPCGSLCMTQAPGHIMCSLSVPRRVQEGPAWVFAVRRTAIKRHSADSANVIPSIPSPRSHSMPANDLHVKSHCGGLPLISDPLLISHFPGTRADSLAAFTLLFLRKDFWLDHSVRGFPSTVEQAEGVTGEQPHSLSARHWQHLSVFEALLAA